VAGIPATTEGGERIVAVGVDGYPRGWVAVVLREGLFDEVRLAARFEEILAAYPKAAAYGVDIPIGLPQTEPRAADLAARRFLGSRSSSVFLTFPEGVLQAASHAEAVSIARELGWPGISQQSFALRRKVLELHALRDDERVIEVHPEVSFCELAGTSLPSKHTWSGFGRRRSLLAGEGVHLPDDLPGAPLVDVLDAAVAALSANRYARGEALPLPEDAAERIGTIWR
jgi:predicted RNase H-like nuclease